MGWIQKVPSLPFRGFSDHCLTWIYPDGDDKRQPLPDAVYDECIQSGRNHFPEDSIQKWNQERNSFSLCTICRHYFLEHASVLFSGTGFKQEADSHQQSSPISINAQPKQDTCPSNGIMIKIGSYFPLTDILRRPDICGMASLWRVDQEHAFGL